MLLVSHRDAYAAERAWIYGVVLAGFLGLEWQAECKATGPIEITLAGSPGRKLVIADELFGTPEPAWLTLESLPRRPLARLDLRATPLSGSVTTEPELPVVYGVSPFAEDHGRDELAIGIDLFGSIFFQLSRYEEIARPERDEHGRFPASALLAVQEGFIERPLVNEYVELLRAALQRLWPSLTTTRRSFRQLLSHDVDWPTHTPLSIMGAVKAMGGDLVRRQDPSLIPTRIATLKAQRRRRPAEDPYNTFDLIMDESERHNLRSAFYFMAGGTDPRFDSGYSLDDEWIQTLLRQVHERGHEIGFHPSYGTFRNVQALRTEFDRLRSTCESLGIDQDEWGGRQHFLRWENPTTWRDWAQVGLAYDSSLGLGYQPGFRCGTCYEYPAFDLRRRQPLGVRERPLIVMEMAVIDNGWRGGAAAIATIDRLRERCRLFGGDFTLLWHNSRLASRREQRLFVQAGAVRSGDLPPRARPNV
jgi:hypothetical protein